jgi:acetyl-CoA carboxylase carboxyl transferase beta subunit/acetyl-CoA carboxylase carboxyl transferase alpha subunit
MAGATNDQSGAPAAQPSRCTRCGEPLDALRVCTGCGRPAQLTAWQRIEQLVDRGSFQETDSRLKSGNPIGFSDGVSSYEKQLAAAQLSTGLLDSVVTGRARLLGHRVVLVVFDFRFLGGSMGSATGEKIARAFELARRGRIPVIVVCSSGGARIQEGMVALFQMAKTSLFAARLHEQGVPLITVLCDPTMGGVLASFASLADVILAEPYARVSFVGPRVHEQAIRETSPPGTAEFALEHGTIDAIIERQNLRMVLGHLAGMLQSLEVRSGRKGRAAEAADHIGDERPVWDRVELARNLSRPSGRDLIRQVFSESVELHGDRVGEDDDSIAAAIARLGGRLVVVVAQDRRSSRAGRTRPSGYRKADRAFTLAERFGLPLVTLIDTPGAATDAEAEAGGITAAIAETLARLARLRTRVVNVVVGEGGSGGALALSPGDRLLMFENAIFSVIGPEAASSILYHDPDHARDLAERLKLTATDLLRLRIVDRILPEQPPGHEAPAVMASVLRQALIDELFALDQVSVKELLARREAKFRQSHSVKGRLSLFGRATASAAGPRG